MKRVAILSSLLLLAAASIGLEMGRAQESAQGAATGVEQPPTHNWAGGNPEKIALLKWYQANTTTRFKVGSQPYGVCFDGANIWTANFGESTVTKLRANDGRWRSRKRVIYKGSTS